MPGFTLINTFAGTPQALTTTYKSLTAAVAASSGARRIRVEELEWSAASVPNATDCQIQADFTFCDATTGGTATTSAAAMPNDSGTAIGTKLDTAISTTALNYTVEPTAFTQAQCWYNRGFNQRSGVLWQTMPGREIILPATASVKAPMRALSTNYTGTAVAREVFDEL